MADSVGWGCPLCLADGQLLVCTELCDSADVDGYTQAESEQRTAAVRDAERAVVSGVLLTEQQHAILRAENDVLTALACKLSKRDRDE
jgi:hypothetical protein